jgi:hypothetical protein
MIFPCFGDTCKGILFYLTTVASYFPSARLVYTTACLLEMTDAFCEQKANTASAVFKYNV